MPGAGWHSWHGSWWAAHYCRDGFFSLGIHIDCRRRLTASERIPYGPYIDVHLGPAVVSVGVNPIWSTEVAASTFRAGRRAG